MKNQDNSTHIWKFIGLTALAVFVGSILWSMWVETLRPLFRQGNTAAIINNLVGRPLILIGVGIFVYGGVVFMRDTFGALRDETMQKNTAVITAAPYHRFQMFQIVAIFLLYDSGDEENKCFTCPPDLQVGAL